MYSALYSTYFTVFCIVQCIKSGCVLVPPSPRYALRISVSCQCLCTNVTKTNPCAFICSLISSRKNTAASEDITFFLSLKNEGRVFIGILLSYSYNHTRFFFLLCHDDYEQITDTHFHNVNGSHASSGPS